MIRRFPRNDLEAGQSELPCVQEARFRAIALMPIFFGFVSSFASWILQYPWSFGQLGRQQGRMRRCRFGALMEGLRKEVDCLLSRSEELSDPAQSWVISHGREDVHFLVGK